VKEWGGPITLYVLVILVASIGVGAGPDGNRWWIVPLAGVAVPVAGVFVVLMMVALDALWGKK
jgi:hypothetical protein